MIKAVKAFTDYPLLDEEAGKIAPIREVTVLSYDGDKYANVICAEVPGPVFEIKRGYLYRKPGRCGEVECWNGDDLLFALMHSSQCID